MGFFAAGDLKASTADRTVWLRLACIRVRNAPADVELECRWYFNDDARAHIDRMKFAELDDAQKDAAQLELIARHVVVGWKNVPSEAGGEELYDMQGCLELLTVLKRSVVKRPDGSLWIPWNDFYTAIIDAQTFGAEIVNATDLGNR